MDRLRFIHIAKTAGTSFQAILLRQYFGKPRFFFSSNIGTDKKAFAGLSQDEREAIMLYYGHSPFMTGLREADSAKKITLLRDPVRRVKSYCQHVYEQRSAYHVDLMNGKEFNLDEFLESGDQELENLQVKVLVNKKDESSDAFFDISSGDQMLDIAKDRLLHDIEAFGLVEYFDESMMVFQSKLGWRMPFYRRKNTASPHAKLKYEKHHERKIAELNELDIALYHAAKKEFIDQVMPNYCSQSRLQNYRRMNGLYPDVMKDWHVPLRFADKKAIYQRDFS